MCEAEITVEIRFVEHGYEIDVFLGSKEESVASQCRDFGKSYDIKSLAAAGFRVVSEDLMPNFRDRIEQCLGVLKDHD